MSELAIRTPALEGHVEQSLAQRITAGTDLGFVLDAIEAVDPIDVETEDASDAEWAVHKALNHVRSEIARRKAVQAGPDAIGDYCGWDGDYGQACGPDLGLPLCPHHSTPAEPVDLAEVLFAPRPAAAPARNIRATPIERALPIVLSALAWGPASRDQLAMRNGVPYAPGSDYGLALDAGVERGLIGVGGDKYVLTAAGVAELAATRPTVAVQAVGCPRCNAPAGTATCYTRDRSPVKYHLARYAKAGVSPVRR